MTSLMCAVQGELLYVEQVEERIERLFAPFSAEIIEPTLGISTADIIKGFQIVRRAIPQRIHESAGPIQPARELWQEWRKRSRAGASDEELDRFVFDHPQYEEICKKVAANICKMNQILLFRPDDFRDELGERAGGFLDAFAFVPGEVNLDLRTPYDDDMVRRRPFAKIGVDKYVLMDVGYSSFLQRRGEAGCRRGRPRKANDQTRPTVESEFDCGRIEHRDAGKLPPLNR